MHEPKVPIGCPIRWFSRLLEDDGARNPEHLVMRIEGWRGGKLYGSASSCRRSYA